MHDDVVDTLLRFGVAPEIMANFPQVPHDVRGLMVYGSQARGDAVADSDLDLLALVATPRPSTHVEAISISYYTRDQLASGIGTLFGAHLKRDGKIISDTDNQLHDAIREMGDVDADRLLRRAAQMSQLFMSPEYDLPKYLPGLVREARYLLRSCLYAQAIAAGHPCFSVREIAERKQDPQLTSILASRHLDEPSNDDLSECLSRLSEIIGAFPPNPHGSLEATIVNEWEQPGDLLSMAFLALGITGQESDYAEVEKILL